MCGQTPIPGPNAHEIVTSQHHEVADRRQANCVEKSLNKQVFGSPIWLPRKMLSFGHESVATFGKICDSLRHRGINPVQVVLIGKPKDNEFSSIECDNIF